jgi:phage repressor protein C with HTH and peptisase S24 domain
MNRREALKRLIDERFEGKQSDFARAIGRSASSVWQWLNGHRNVGEKVAREIERKLRLPRGYLDDDPYQFEKDLFDFLSQVKGQPIDTIEDPSVREIAKRMEGVIVPAPSQPTSADNELEFIGHMDAWDSDTPLDEDEVELPLFREVELAAGAGQTQVIENHGAKLRFAKSTLSRAGVVEENAACAFVRGNSMEPVMPDGTCVGVNTGDTAIRDGEIYAIDHDGMLRVKYLHRRPGGGIKIVSQNSSEHATEEYSAQAVIDNNIRVIGRVFWWSVLR